MKPGGRTLPAASIYTLKNPNKLCNNHFLHYKIEQKVRMRLSITCKKEDYDIHDKVMSEVNPTPSDHIK